MGDMRNLMGWMVVVALGLVGPPAMSQANAAAQAQSNAPSPPQVQILIDLRDTSKAAHIELQFPRQQTDRIELALDDWGGLSQLADGIQQITASVDGKPTSVQVTSDGKWQLRAPAGEQVRLRYAIAANRRYSTGDDRDHYRPIVTPDLFHAVGHNTLILPNHLPGPWQVTLRWLLPPARGWRTASSFAAGETVSRFAVRPELLADSLLVAGAIRVLERKVHEQPVFLAIHGNSWQFSDAEFADRVQHILATERGFVGDYDFPHYLVSVLAVGQPIDNGYSLNGTRLHRSFALFMNPNASLATSSPVTGAVEGLLMHETFHEWNGGQLSGDPKLPDGELYWFTEGLTNFYTRKLLQRAGLRTEAETLASVNALLKRYHLSPVREASNADIVAKFWQSAPMQELPYDRGDLLALYLDGRIRQISAGKQSLDDLFFALLAASRQGKPLTLDAFVAALTPWLPVVERASLREFVERGGELGSFAQSLPSCAMLQATPFYQWFAGFDVDASLANRVVQGVVPGSNAAQAGLRNGDKLLGWSFQYNNPDSPVELTLDGSKNKLAFLPRGSSQTAPQLQLQGETCTLWPAT